MPDFKPFLLSLTMLTALGTGCAAKEPAAESSALSAVSEQSETQAVSEQGASAVPERNEDPTESFTPKEETVMTLTVGKFTFTVLPEENEAAAALLERLPLQLAMSELNGNEKYNYLPFSLPSDPFCPGEIRAGDVMLYGDNCLVVFYESFSTPYRYTRIGHIEDVSSLREACGKGNVQMTFSIG